jgi:DNA-binding phage protein
MTKKSEQIFIGIDNQIIELTGADKEAFLADIQANANADALLEAQYQAKQTARANAITKLAEIAGLTEEEINSIL